MAVVTMKQLLESGVHFGHQTRRWNPKMKRFIFTERNGIYIIDLQQSLSYIDRAYEFVKETVAHGGSVLFVGTKKQAQEAVREQATRVGMPYVTERWLGGMLTNFQTVHKRLQRLKELEELDFDDPTASGLTKKELLMRKREMEKLQRSLGGVRDMARIPSAVWIVDTKKEHLAVDEARKLNIPIVAILDTNCDPDEVTYPIPGNDDAIRAVTLLTRVVADAVADGLIARAGQAGGDETPGVELAGDEPLAEWEKELLAGQPEQASVTDEVEAAADTVEGAPPVGAETAAEAADDAGSPPVDVVADEAADDAGSPPVDVVADEAADDAGSPPVDVVADEAADDVGSPPVDVVADEAADDAGSPPVDVVADEAADDAGSPPVDVVADEAADDAGSPPVDVVADEADADQGAQNA